MGIKKFVIGDLSNRQMAILAGNSMHAVSVPCPFMVITPKRKSMSLI